MIWGMLLAMAAGSMVSVQTMFNTKVNAAVSSRGTTALVLGMGFLASLVVGLLVSGADFFAVKSMPLWYWFSGLVGIGVVTCIVSGIKHLGASFSTSVLMSSQLICALWWDSMGWFGLERVPFTWQKGIGVVVLIVGLVLFKMKPAQGAKVVRAEQ